MTSSLSKTARSCRFALHNIRKIRPFHTQHAAQLLVQALVISRLRCSSSWTSIKHNQTFTDDSECSGTIGFQRAQKSPCYTSLYLPALAPGCSSHPVQDTDACIQNNHRLSTHLLPLTDDNLHPLQKPEICEWASPRGAITERHKITFQNVFIHRSWPVEWSSHPIWNAVSDNFQATQTHLFHFHLTSASSFS